MEKPFDLNAAMQGSPILCDKEPAKFIAYVPDNLHSFRVVVSYKGLAIALSETGCASGSDIPRLTMADTKEVTAGYREFYWRSKESKNILKCVTYSLGCISEVESDESFVRWIHTDWQHDEVLL